MGRPAVAVADEDVLFGSALTVVLADAGYDIIAHATSCQEARDQVTALPELDLLLTSSTLPGDRAALARVLSDHRLRLVVLSAVTEHAELVSALDHGAQGYLGKDARLTDLLGSVAAVLRGEAAVPRHMLGGLLHELVTQRRQATTTPGDNPLSRREQEVLELLAQGHSQEGIARALVISPQTARTHIQKVIGKLGVHSRVEAVAVAVERGLVSRLMTSVRIPRHAPGVVLHQQDDRAQLLAPITGAVVTLDPLALALWEMCDGETTVQEMTSASCALFDAAPDTVERDITRVLTALEQQLLLEWVPHPADGSAR